MGGRTLSLIEPLDCSPLRRSAVKGPYTPSVDRVTAGAGYTRSNCRLVLMCVNSALMWWGLEAFIPVAKAIAEKNP